MFVRQINLDVRTDRWEECIRNHAAMGFSPQDIPRFSACRDSHGSLGRAKSHIAVLSEFYTATTEEFAMVLEDDFDFSIRKEAFEARLQAVQDSRLEWDVLMLAGGDVISLDAKLDGLKKLFESPSTCGYILRRRYVLTLLPSFLEAARELNRFRAVKPIGFIEKRFAIGQVWKRLQQDGNWYLFSPRAGVVRPSFSDVEQQFVDPAKDFAP